MVIIEQSAEPKQALYRRPFETNHRRELISCQFHSTVQKFGLHLFFSPSTMGIRDKDLFLMLFVDEPPVQPW